MSCPSIAAAAPRLASFLLGTALVLSCTSDNPGGPKENRGPTAKITLPSGPLLEGAVLTFDARNSTDPDGDSLTYHWNLGGETTRTGAVATRTYLDEGDYGVTLIVSDPYGAEDRATARVVVENAAPVVGQIVGPTTCAKIGTVAIRTALQRARYA
jgi:hypothetical protein